MPEWQAPRTTTPDDRLWARRASVAIGSMADCDRLAACSSRLKSSSLEFGLVGLRSTALLLSGFGAKVRLG